MAAPDLPPDPFADETGQVDLLEDGERLLLLLVEAALDPGLARLAASMRALDEEDLRRIVVAQAISLAAGIREKIEAERAPRRRRLRRAAVVAVRAFRREMDR